MHPSGSLEAALCSLDATPTTINVETLPPSFLLGVQFFPHDTTRQHVLVSTLCSPPYTRLVWNGERILEGEQLSFPDFDLKDWAIRKMSSRRKLEPWAMGATYRLLFLDPTKSGKSEKNRSILLENVSTDTKN